jgi:DNA repair protein RadC
MQLQLKLDGIDPLKTTTPTARKADRAQIRERLNQYGAHALNNEELVALITKTDTATARGILNKAGNLLQLGVMSALELERIMTPTQAESIRAALDFSNRVHKATRPDRERIVSPEDANNYLQNFLRYEQVEKFIAIFLNTKNYIIGHEIISIGSLNATVVHPRETFNRAILHRASAIIVAHNHPSGDPTPSREDIEMTNRLKEAGQVIGIDLLDHLIITENGFTSLNQQGLM